MATVLVQIIGTKGIFNPGEDVNVIVQFMNSGNYLISSLDGRRRVYADKSEIEIV